MRTRLCSLIFTALLASSIHAATEGSIALVDGTLINPDTGKVTPNACIVIEGDHISAVDGKVKDCAKEGMRIVDCKSKFILPGYIDTHVHFFQSGDIYTRPDAVDLTAVRPYRDEVAWVKQKLPDALARYLRCGITAVVDVGGPFWNFEARKIANATARAPRVAAAGPLISSVARPQLDLGDPPIIKIDTAEQGRELVRKLAEQKTDYVKIWYIVNEENPVEKFRPVVEAVIAESHARKIRVAVHATELEAARAAVEAGADLLVHSVTDKLVDDRFVKLLKERGTILTPTLVVFERYGRTFANKLNLTKEEKAWGNPEVIASLDVTKIPAGKIPDRIKTSLEKPDAVLDRIHKTYDVALKNLKTLLDGGVTIAAGTDAGNIGTIHGPALFREFQLMKEGGLTPMQILRCATANAAKVFDTAGGTSFGTSRAPKIGTVAPGNYADLVILRSNPLEDIAYTSHIEMVMKNGVLYPADSLLPR